MRWFLILLSILPLTPALAEPVLLSNEVWAVARSGDRVAHEPVVAGVITALEKRSDGAILIAHGTDEQSQLRAEELRSWLVALGVASRRIYLQARPELQQELMLDVVEHSNL